MWTREADGLFIMVCIVGVEITIACALKKIDRSVAIKIGSQGHLGWLAAKEGPMNRKRGVYPNGALRLEADVHNIRVCLLSYPQSHRSLGL